MTFFTARVWSEQDDALIKEGYLTGGRSLESLAEELRCDPAGIHRRLLKMGIHGREKPVLRDTPWNEGLIAKLKKHWEIDGWSALEIGIELGFTRSAVMGKINRMGLRPPANKKGNKKPKAIKAKAKVSARTGYLVKPLSTKAPTKVTTKVHSLVEVDRPNENKPGISIMGLNDATCHAIIGRGSDGLATYCGDPTFGAKPFCAGHCKIYYQPYEPRRR